MTDDRSTHDAVRKLERLATRLSRPESPPPSAEENKKWKEVLDAPDVGSGLAILRHHWPRRKFNEREIRRNLAWNIKRTRPMIRPLLSMEGLKPWKPFPEFEEWRRVVSTDNPWARWPIFIVVGSPRIGKSLFFQTQYRCIRMPGTCAVRELQDTTNAQFILWDGVPWKSIPVKRGLTNSGLGNPVSIDHKNQNVTIRPSIILWTEDEYAAALRAKNNALSDGYWQVNATVVKLRGPMYE